MNMCVPTLLLMEAEILPHTHDTEHALRNRNRILPTAYHLRGDHCSY